MKKQSLKIEKYINPEIKVGDNVLLYDGSAFTHETDSDYIAITRPYNKRNIREALKNYTYVVKETNQEYVHPFEIGSVAYLQDILIEHPNGELFRTSSAMVHKDTTGIIRNGR